MRRISTHLMGRGAMAWRGAVLACCALAIGCSGGGGGSDGVTSDPAAGVFVGTIVDESGKPVAGASVSVEGVEAASVTGSDGTFVVNDPSLAVAAASLDGSVAASTVPHEVVVRVPGFNPHVGSLEVATGGVASIEVIQNTLEPSVHVVSPSGSKVLQVPVGCSDPHVLVEGFVRLGTVENLSLDVIVVVDRSGSTSRLAFDVNGDDIVDSVLDAEVSAVRCLLDTLDETRTRVSVVAFNDAASVVSPFGSDFVATSLALDGVGGSTGGTNYEAAFLACRDLFNDLEAADKLDVENDGISEPTLERFTAPERIVVFLTDGIPTSHGVPRNLEDSNLTQSFEDRRRSIEAAEALGEETGATLSAFSIISSSDTNLKRSTLPHCVGICGGGEYQNFTDAEQMTSAICGTALEKVFTVEIINRAIENEPVRARVRAGGLWSALVPVHQDGTDLPVANLLEVRATAFSGAVSKQTQADVSFKIVTAAGAASLGRDQVTDAMDVFTPVSSRTHLLEPEGGKIAGNRLYDLLVGDLAGEFEDAVELVGSDVFDTYDTTSSGASDVTLTVDFVFNRACYKSDFGYILYDPADPPKKAWRALRDLPASQILFNSGPLIDAEGCMVGSIPQGSQTYTMTVPAGSKVAFFILPNRTLADYKAKRNRGNAPLFTIPALNPGKFDQCLTFLSEVGRTETGSSTTVVNGGPLRIFAFEDIQRTKHWSDEDFDDVVFTVKGGLTEQIDALQCLDELP